MKMKCWVTYIFLAMMSILPNCLPFSISNLFFQQSRMRRSNFQLHVLPHSNPFKEFVSGVSLSSVDIAVSAKKFGQLLRGLEVTEESSLLIEKSLRETLGNQSWDDHFIPRQSFVAAISEAMASVIQTPSIDDSPPQDDTDIGQTICLVGSPRSGKSTAAVKLARHLLATSLAKRVLLVVADLEYSDGPPALQSYLMKEQSRDEQCASVEIFADKYATISEICQQASLYAADSGFDAVIYDIAGVALEDEAGLVETMELIHEIAPTDVFAVLDASKGSLAASTAAKLSAKVGITGSILAKSDSTSLPLLAAASLSVSLSSGQPVHFLSSGTRASDLKPVQPVDLAMHILGESSDAVVGDSSESRELSSLKGYGKLKGFLRKNARKGVDWTYDDYLDLIDKLRDLGGIDYIIKEFNDIGMTSPPRFTKERMADGENQLLDARVIIGAMTPEERKNPDLLAQEGGRISSLKRRLDLAKRTSYSIVVIESFIKKFREIRKEMCKFTRHYEPKEALEVDSEASQRRLNRLQRPPARGFGPALTDKTSVAKKK